MGVFLRVLFSRYAWTAACVVACTGERATPPIPTDGPDVYLAVIERTAGTWTLTRLQNATNRPGYDNQPHFTPDGGALLYTSQRDGQTDIHRIDLATGETRPLTRTPESEYSATTMPGGDSFSVIRVEADSAQRLWAFDWAGQPQAPIFERIAPVGYHAWLDADRVALFVLPVDSLPITLRLASVANGEASVVRTDIGRSLHRIPGETALSYVDQTTSEWWIMRLDPATGASARLAPVVDGAEDYTWTPDGTLVMGAGSQLYRWADSAWVAWADLAADSVGGITRLAISPDGQRIAIVAAGPD